MEHRVVGDSILFESDITDRDGTAITGATVLLSVVDGSGSTVLSNAVVPHVSNGTYRVTGSTAGWNFGPVIQTWVAKHSAGTSTEIIKNQFRVIGTQTIQTYISPSELEQYYDNISDYLDGNEDGIVVDSFNEINSRLEAMGIKTPIAQKPDGFYDQPLRDLNAYDSIIRIVSRRQSGYKRNEDSPWFTYFGSMAHCIYKKIENKTYNFDRDYSVSEAGIGIATKTTGTRPGAMETNWRGGVGTGFSDASFERDWVVEIIGTGVSAGVNESIYRWSNDSGITYGTKISSYSWEHLQDGVYVRFHKGTGTTSTSNVFGTGDAWTWKTFPANQSAGGHKSARSY